MAAAPEKSKVMIEIGQLLDKCRECPKNESDTRTEKERAAVCGGCPVYAGFLKYREFLGAYDDRRNKTKRGPSRFHLLTPELYRQHKRDGWIDNDILEEYRVGRTRLNRWKKEHFTEDELKAMYLPAGKPRKEKEA